MFGRELAISGVGLLALALVGVLTWFVVHDTPRHARAGDLVTGYISSTAPSRDVVVLEPWGRVDVHVGSPRRALPSEVTYERGKLRPPDGGRFVGVQWSGTTSYEPQTVALAPYPRTHVSLVADGHALPLDTASVAADPCPQSGCTGDDSDNSVWVAVPGAATRLQVAVEFDGVTQTVDVQTKVRHPGLAAALYASTAGSTLSPDCGPLTLSSGFRPDEDTDTTDTCHLVAYRSAYVSGRGWARAGTEWVVVNPTIDPPFAVVRAAHGGTPAIEYRTADAGVDTRVTARLAGAASGGPLVPAGTDLTDPAHTADNVSVFAVPVSAPTGTLTLSRSVALVPDYRDVPLAAAHPTTVRLTWTVSK